MQPPSSSTNSSALARRAASTPIAPISFSTTAMRRPCGARSRALIRVVFPLPRKPPTMVTGMRTSGATRLRQQAGHAALRQQVDGVRPADGAADLVRERLAALGELRRADLEQPAIVGEAQRGLEQHPRHRLRAPDAALQEV